MTALTDDVRDLLTAIRAMVDVPLAAAGDDRAERDHIDLMRTRAAMLRGAINATLTLPADLDITTRVIRQSTAETPVTYAVYVPPGKDTEGATQADADESTQAHETVRITASPSDPGTVTLHLPEFSYMDTAVWSIEVAIPRAHLPALRAAIDETERHP